MSGHGKPNAATPSKEERTMAHFHEQKGICWICGFPMLPFSTGQGMPRMSATLDHLAERNSTNGASRPTKAAHRVCNSARGHNHTVSEKHLADMDKLFSTRSWRLSTFGGNDPGYSPQASGEPR